MPGFLKILPILVAAGITGCSAMQTSVTPGVPSLAARKSTPATQPTSLPTMTQPAAPFAISATRYFDVGVQPRELAVADLNNDGNLDVAVANSGDGTLSLLLGSGDEQLLAAPVSIVAGEQPADVDATDVDLDGDVDLIIANHDTANVTILLNDGAAHFEEAPYSPINTGARPHVHGLATADYNGDGWADIAVESADTGEVRVLLGAQEGFGDVIPVSIGAMPYFRIGAADMDGDGVAELLVPGHSDNTVRIFQYGADGFQLQKTIELEGQPWIVIGDDVNGDGSNDVIVVETDAVGIWLASGDEFQQAPGSPYRSPGANAVSSGDINGDGIAEIAVGPWDGTEVMILWGGDFRTSRVSACERPIGLALADMNRDGKAELLATCTTEDRLAILSP